MPNPLYLEENHDFYHVGLLPQSRNKTEEFFKNSIFNRFYACIIYDTLGFSGISIRFTPIPLVYLQIEKNDKIPHVNVHRVKLTISKFDR